MGKPRPFHSVRWTWLRPVIFPASLLRLRYHNWGYEKLPSAWFQDTGTSGIWSHGWRRSHHWSTWRRYGNGSWYGNGRKASCRNFQQRKLPSCWPLYLCTWWRWLYDGRYQLRSILTRRHTWSGEADRIIWFQQYFNRRWHEHRIPRECKTAFRVLRFPHTACWGRKWLRCHRQGNWISQGRKRQTFHDRDQDEDRCRLSCQGRQGKCTRRATRCWKCCSPSCKPWYRRQRTFRIRSGCLRSFRQACWGEGNGRGCMECIIRRLLQDISGDERAVGQLPQHRQRKMSLWLGRVLEFFRQAGSNQKCIRKAFEYYQQCCS